MTLLFWLVALVTVGMNYIPKYKNIIMQKVTFFVAMPLYNSLCLTVRQSLRNAVGDM